LDKNRKSSIPRASKIEQIGDFWDTHNFNEHESAEDDVIFIIACAIPIELELLASIEEIAQR